MLEQITTRLRKKIFCSRLRDCPAGRAHCAWGGHFVMGIPLRLALPLVAKEDYADQREEHAKP